MKKGDLVYYEAPLGFFQEIGIVIGEEPKKNEEYNMTIYWLLSRKSITYQSRAGTVPLFQNITILSTGSRGQ